MGVGSIPFRRTIRSESVETAVEPVVEPVPALAEREDCARDECRSRLVGAMLKTRRRYEIDGKRSNLWANSPSGRYGDECKNCCTCRCRDPMEQPVHSPHGRLRLAEHESSAAGCLRGLTRLTAPSPFLSPTRPECQRRVRRCVVRDDDAAVERVCARACSGIRDADEGETPFGRRGGVSSPRTESPT